MEITVKATTEEKLDLVFTALCSQLPFFRLYGYELKVKGDEYDVAHKALTDGSRHTGKLTTAICEEHVWVQMLRMGYGLKFQGDEKQGGEAKTATLTLKLIERNWKKVPAKIIMEFIAENDDAHTADSLIQYLLLSDEIYG
jgi:hypothetical protein